MVRIPFGGKKLPPKPEATTRPKVAPQKPVEVGTIRGEVRYPWGRVAGATIRVGNRSAVTDTDGNYEIPAVDVGSYSVSVEAPFPGYEATSENVTIETGKTGRVDFYLDFAKTVVHGYVRDEDGKPIAGAILSGVKCGKDMRSTVTDGTGYFKFEDASPGTLFIRANAAGHMGQTRDFTTVEGGKTLLEFHMTPAKCKVYGTVSDKEGHPLGGEVFLSSEVGIILQKSPSNVETGYYEFPVVPATYNILASAAGHISEGWKGMVSADTKVDLKLDPQPKEVGPGHEE